MTLQELLAEDGNTVELYFCPEEVEKDSPVFPCAWKTLPRLPLGMYKGRLDQEIMEYSYRGLLYQYDVSNDAQRTVQRGWSKDSYPSKKEYLVVLQEEALPCHRFPCTTELREPQRYHKVQYKINNRMSLVIEKGLGIGGGEEAGGGYTIYLRYQHAPQVDLVKMDEEWNEASRQLRKMAYMN